MHEADECLNMIKEAFPNNYFDTGINKPLPNDIRTLLDGVSLTLADWSKQVYVKPKVGLSVSQVFLLKKIVVVVKPVNNKYLTMIKIMADSQENLFSLSQMLFCSKQTTSSEIAAFSKRALLDPYKRIYFVLNIHDL